MSTILWCDRKNYKSDFQRWLEADDKLLAFGISSSQELMDIANWIKSNFKDNYSIGMTHYESNVIIQRPDLLEALTIGLGEKRFQNFYKFLNNIGINKNNNIFIIQEAGKEASAGDKIEFNVNQTINVESQNRLIPTEVSIERETNQLLTEFLNDMKISTELSFLLIIRFGLKGFDGFSADFKRWFLNIFCRKIELLENVKICILNQGNADIFNDYCPNYEKNIPEYLELNEILLETKKQTEKLNGNYIDFCCGAIEPEHNNVEYHKFKRKLEAYKENKRKLVAYKDRLDAQ